MSRKQAKRKTCMIPRLPLRFLPTLESLEDRRVPALIQVIGFTDEDPGAFIIADVGNNTFTASSLRAAVDFANNGSPDVADRILLPTGNYVLDKAGSGPLRGDLDITEELTIEGAGNTLTFINAFSLEHRIFDIDFGVTATIDGVRLANATLGDPGGGSSFSNQGGAIRNFGDLTITDCYITNNQVVNDDNCFGGAIYSDGSLTITNSSIIGNSVLPQFGGEGSGGGVYSIGTLQIENSTIADNVVAPLVSFPTSGAAFGGGVYANGDATLVGSFITNNQALGGDINGDAEGGGVYFDGAGGGTLIIDNTDITDNTAEGDSGITADDARGGGVFVIDGDLEIVSLSTIGDNLARGGDDTSFIGGGSGGSAEGGGVYRTGSGSALIEDSLINDNRAIGGDSLINFGPGEIGGDAQGGGFWSDGSSFQISILTTQINGNLALGGDADDAGGVAEGGGFWYFGGDDVDIHDSVISFNNAIGGDAEGTSPPGGANIGGDAFGGGIYFDGSNLMLIRDTTIEGNEAEGGDGGTGPGGDNAGGSALGGGLILEGSAFLVQIQQSLIIDNEANGGNGNNLGTNTVGGGSGGNAEGGGIWSAVFGLDIVDGSVIADNHARGGQGGRGADGISGSVPTPGFPGFSGGDALGGGIHNDGVMSMDDSEVSGNDARAGDGGTGGTGGVDTDIAGLSAPGGGGGSGGLAAGGGILNDFFGILVVDRCLVSSNQVFGGNGGDGGLGGNGGTGVSGPGGPGGNAGDLIGPMLVSAGGGGFGNLGGTIRIIFETTIDSNTVVGGAGGRGGNGGSAGAGVGGPGGAGGVAGAAGGGGVGSTAGDIGDSGTPAPGILSSTISNNFVAGGSGGSGGHGGNGGLAGLGGPAQDGGAVAGGGVLTDEGFLFISNSTVSTNVIFGGGGGLGGQDGNGGSFQPNADGGDAFGGGVANFGGLTPSRLGNSTIAFNTAAGGGGVNSGDASGGGVLNLLGLDETVIYSTIISNNGLGGSGTNLGPDAFSNPGGIDSEGFNLVGNDADVAAEFDGPGDILNGFADLGPLQDNGGLTATHLPGPLSDAIDAGDNPDGLPEDQRGFPRESGAQIDIGSVETRLPLLAVGSSLGVRLFEGTDPTPLFPTFTGLGDRVALGDITGDGADDLAIGSSKGGRTVTLINGLTGVTFATFQAFGVNFKGGVYVATGDVNGDGFNDVIVGRAKGKGTIQVFDGDTLSTTPFLTFNAFGKTANGVRVAAGDVDGVGSNDDIIATKGSGTVSRVKVFHFDGIAAVQVDSFRPFGTGYTGGTFVAAGDFDNDGRDDIVVGRGKGATRIRVFDRLDDVRLANFLAFPGSKGGARVAATDVDRDGSLDIMAGRGGQNIADVSFFDLNGTVVDSFQPFGVVVSGVYVAGGG